MASLSVAAGSYIRDRLREVSFSRKILPPHPLQPILDLHSSYPISPVPTTPKILNTPATREAICTTAKDALLSLLLGKPK